MRRTSAMALLAAFILGLPIAMADQGAAKQITAKHTAAEQAEANQKAANQSAANTVPTDERGLPLRKPAEGKTGLEDIMCHMCEWRPHPFVLPAGAQCGVNAKGDPNQGVFSCGLEKNCDKRCDFVECQGT